MVRSQVLAFAEPLAYQAAFRGEMELFLTDSGDFHAELTKIDLGQLWMQRGFDNLARVVRTSALAGRIPVLFFADTRQAPWQYDGVELSPGDFVFFGQSAAHHHHRTVGACRWATMSLTADGLAAAGEAIVGRELAVPSQTQVFRPAQEPMARLMALHTEADRLARIEPDTLARPEVARALEQELMHAMIACLAPHRQTGTRSCEGRHAKVMARFEDFLAAKRYEPVYLAEICAAIAVSERTLRTCCQERLGMGPIHYLWLRRMHLARRALLCADPATTTVTEIATDCGFWELGRFSVGYRTLFRESPSVSLHRPPDGQA